jgi:hypothetical protein
MIRRTILYRPFVVLLALACHLSSACARQSNGKSKSADVFEAVVRYQIKSWELTANSYCISIEAKDATKEFLKRFDPLPVDPASNCRKQTKEKAVVVVTNKRNGKRSVIFNVESVRWISENEAEVAGGYFCGSFCSASGIYHLSRKGDVWVVTTYDVDVQS